MAETIGNPFVTPGTRNTRKFMHEPFKWWSGKPQELSWFTPINISRTFSMEKIGRLGVIKIMLRRSDSGLVTKQDNGSSPHKEITQRKH